MSGDPRSKATEQLERFAKALEDANRRLSKPDSGHGPGLGSTGGGAASSASAGGGASDYVRAFREGAEVVQIFTDVLRDKTKDIGGLLGEAITTLTERLSQTATVVQGLVQFLETSARARGAVTAQLAPFALSGVEVPNETIRQVAEIEAGRSQRITDLENRARASVNVRLAEMQIDRVTEQLRQLGPGSW